MSVNEEEKQKPKPLRRSSLKQRQPLQFDPDAILNKKAKRKSVSWGKSSGFQFKAMKAMFTESVDLNKKETEEDKKKHQKFLENRKQSIKNEFSIIKELMKKNKDTIIEEENDEEAKNNMEKNVENIKEELKEISESSSSGSKCSSCNNSDDESKSKSKSSSKSASRSNSKSAFRNSKHESEDKSAKKHKHHKKNQKSEISAKSGKSSKSEKENDKGKKESKLKNKRLFHDEEKDNNLEKEEEKEKEQAVKNESEKEKENHKEIAEKKKIKFKVAEKKDEKKEEDKLNEKENGQKLRLINLKEAHNLELEKIAYITLVDGSVIIIKNQGENLVQDLLKFKNPINQNTKIQILDPFDLKSSENKIEISTNQSLPQSQYNIKENVYKNKINNNLSRNKSYNKDVNSKLNQRTYVISTGQSKLKEITGCPSLSNDFNKPSIVPKPNYSNQGTQKAQYYSNNNFNKNEYQKFNFSNINNTPLSQYKTKSNNLYQNFVQSNLYQSSRNIPPNSVGSSRAQYLSKIEFQNSYNTRPVYSEYMKNYRLIDSKPMNINDNWNYNYNLTKKNLSNPLISKPYYQVSQQNNRYQYQRQPINITDRRKLNFNNRFNSNEEGSQMFESFNNFDNLEEELYNPENEDNYRDYDLYH